MNNYQGSAKYKPLSPWGYFGYTLLFGIPFIGWIINIVFCFDDGNINRRNFARSFWCMYLIVAVIAVLVGGLCIAVIGLAELESFVESVGDTISYNI